MPPQVLHCVCHRKTFMRSTRTLVAEAEELLSWRVYSGADYVFHSASPVVLQSDHPQEDIVDPAVKVHSLHQSEEAAV